MASYFRNIEDVTAFDAARMTKRDLAAGGQMFVGLNCFEPGQSQPVHAHSGSDKFYLVLSGRATLTVGPETSEARAGTLVWAPADVPHGVLQAHERTVLLVAMAPPAAGSPRGGHAPSP